MRQLWTTSFSVLLLLAACGDADVSLPAQDSGPSEDTDATEVVTIEDTVHPVDTAETTGLVCGPGTQVDPSGTMCVPVVEPGDNVTTCPEGYVPSNTSGGETVVCVPVMPVTVHGFVTDSQTGSTIPDVNVTLYPGLGEEILTGADGYFRVDGLPYSGQMKVVYAVEGYEVAERDLVLPFEWGDGIKVLLVDASTSMKALPGEGPVVPSDGEGWLSGTVYAGLGAAVSVPVYLRNDTLGEDVASTLTASDGAFSLSEIAADGYSFTLRISPWDADDDGVYDYQGESIYLGDILAGDGEVNLSNIVIVLEPVQKYLAYVNLLPSPGHISGPGYYTGLNLPDPGSDLILHFGAETEPDTLDLSLVELLGGAVGSTLDVNVSWNAAGTAMSINPAATLEKDADPTTLYELRISGLLWADGSPFVPLDAGPTGGLRLRFDVADSPTYLTSPDPNIYVGNFVDEDQAVAQMSCDSRACWLLDPFGYPFNGLNDPSVNAPADCFFNGASGFQLTWTGVTGAAGYKVYARQSYKGLSGEQIQGWHEVAATISSSFSDPLANPTIYASGVFASGQGPLGWDDFGIGKQGGQVGNPLAFDNVIELAVTALDVAGYESAIDEGSTIILSDFHKAGVQHASEVNGGNAPQKGSTELGDTGVEKIFDIRFTELGDASSNVSIEVRSGKIVESSGPAFTTWNPDGTGSAGTLSDEARFGPMTLDFRGVCAQITAPAEPTDTFVSVRSLSVFQDGGDVFFVNSSGSGLSHNGTRQIVDFDLVSNTIELANTLEDSNTGTIPAGAFACVVGPVVNHSTNIANAADSGDGFVEVSDQSPFHPNQKIIIVSFNPDPVMMTATVLRVVPVEKGGGAGQFVLADARLDITPSMQFTRDNAVILPRPLNSEHSLRKAKELVLSETVITEEGVPLSLTPSSMMASSMMEDDLLLVDIDGVWDTILDRYLIAAGEVEMNTGNFDGFEIYAVGAKPAPGKLFGLPSGLTLSAGVTRIVWLGDNFKLTGLSDTSGNDGLNEFADEFSFCDPGLAGCEGGIFTH